MVMACIFAFTPVLPGSVPVGPPTFSTPLDFTNLYFPFEPGAVKVFNGRSSGARVVVVDLYLEETRAFNWGGGVVECRILQETEFERGEIVEISLNYFAEADNGTAYYFGEVVDEYEDGVVVSHEGSWLVGGATLPSDPPGTAVAVDPTIFMPADPEVGDVFKPEDLPPIVEETDEVIRVGRKVRVPAGAYEDVIQIRETQMEGDVEYKWYAPGVGVIRARGKGENLLLIASTLTMV